MKEVRLRGKKLVDATGISNTAIQQARRRGRLAKHKDGNTVEEVLSVCKIQPFKSQYVKSPDGIRRAAAKAGRKPKGYTPPETTTEVSQETQLPADLSSPKSHAELQLLRLHGQAANENLRALEKSGVLVNAHSASVAIAVVSREVVFGTKNFISSNGEAWRKAARKKTETEWRDFMIQESERLFSLIGEDAVIKKFAAALDAEENARRKKRDI